ncbi:MAG: BamA/TamA family outer membrane protein [Planctomycetota bacterium]
MERREAHRVDRRAARSWLLAALALLCALGCRSTAPTAMPENARVEFVGVPDEDVPALRERVRGLLDDFDTRGGALAFLDDAAFEVRQFYRDLGHAYAEARFEAPGPDGRIRFEVDAGPMIELIDLRVEGALWLGAEEARRLFAFPVGSRDGLPVEWFTRKALDEGLRALEERYYRDGYLEAFASVFEVRLDPVLNQARVIVDLVEGPRFRTRRIEVESNGPAIDELIRDTLRDFSDRPYSPRAVYRLRGELLELLGNAGYPDAFVDVLPSVDSTIGAADLRVIVDAGPLVTVGDVRIEGAESIRRGFVLKRLKLRPGERYSRDKARRSFERLLRSGLFDRVAVRLDGGGGERRDLVVELGERPSQEVFLEPGYGAYELARFKAGYRELNLLGTGRQARVQGVVAVRAVGAEVGLSDPDFLREDLLGDLSVAYERREEPSFTREELSTAFRLRWPWLRNLDGNFAYEYRQIDLEDVEIDLGNELVILEAVDVSSFLLSPQYDSRDNLFVPTRGATAEVGIEWASSAIGSEIDFIRPTIVGTRYFTLDDQGSTVLALGGRIGWIVPAGDTELIPLQERFFNGGPTTVRAFARYELGPQDPEGNALGGEGQTVFNVELRQQIYHKLHGALFYDVGNVVLDYQELTEFGDFAGGPGFGLRYLTPIGPIRADFAFNADPRQNEDAFVFHIAVGMPF